ncbi:MAG TPA: hypothetical protein VEW48_11770 [Thermoanaerobaculia bacterium]|nr:hypothetical protein [Thermoanaerobaculia bacterium]
MKLPGADRAIVDEAKVRDYLLSPEHPIGRFKAAFFASVGYTRQDWEWLRQEFVSIAASEDATLGQSNAFGQKYEVRGRIEGPKGRRFEIVTVWIVLRGESVPRFVTAYPG